MMVICAYCDHENINGVDVCENCQQPLVDEHLTTPATAVERSLLADRIGLLQSQTPITVAPEAPIAEVLRLLVANRIGCVFVVQDGKIVGLFSERDAVLRVGVEVSTLGDRPVSEFMTPRPQCLKPDAKIVFAVQRMDQGGFRHVPIVNEDGQPTGVISIRDILRYLTDKMASQEIV